MRKHLAWLGTFFVLAVIYTLPASLKPRSGLIGLPGDNYQHAWSLWYFAKAVAGGENPFYTRLLFFPHGVNLAWSTLDPLAGAMALPASFWAGPAEAYNFSIILQLALSAFFARLLCLKICGNELAATLGGLAFGFSPFLLAHALGHLSLVTAFPIPLFFLALDRVLTRVRPSAMDGALLGLALLLTAFAHLNYTVFCAIFGGLVVVVEVVRGKVAFIKRARLPLATAAGVFLLTFAPMLGLLVGGASDVPSPRPMQHIEEFSADALGTLMPGWIHPVFGKAAEKWNPYVYTVGFESVVYVGPVLLLLAAWGWRRRTQSHSPWALWAGVGALAFFLLALGPRVHVLGRRLPIYGPSALIYRVPMMRFLSAPARFHVIVALSAAILASMGVAAWVAKIERSPRRWLAGGAVGVLFVLETIPVPFPASSVAEPGTPTSLESAKGCEVPSESWGGSVLTFPLIDWPYSVKSMWMQAMQDGRYALVDGYVSYASKEVWYEYYRVPIVRALMSVQGTYDFPVNAARDRETSAEMIRELDLRGVIVYDSPRSPEANQYLRSVFGIEGKREGSCTVFEIHREQVARH